MRDFYFQGQFKKDLKLVQKRHYDMDEIYDVITMILRQEPIPIRPAPGST
jgi:mRNA-degrading endonuclease YafQ of YafQ-DinJ toxin-antitoxin module